MIYIFWVICSIIFNIRNHFSIVSFYEHEVIVCKTSIIVIMGEVFGISDGFVLQLIVRQKRFKLSM